MKKSFALILALVLVVTAVAGGTIAWLTATTTPVTNTFTTAGIGITLIETMNTDKDGDGTNDAWEAKMVPGYEYTKDPVVTVTAETTEDVFLFVKFEETGATQYLTYTSNLNGNGWTQGTGAEGNGVPTNVWYREVGANDETKSWHLLDGDKVAIKDSLKKEDMTADGFTAPQLKYTAYACQAYKNSSDKFTAAEAWAKVGN